VDFKPKLVRRNKEGHIILIKGAIHEEKIIIINSCTPNVSAPNFINHTIKDLKSQIDLNTVVARVLNTTLSKVDRSPRQKINKEILELNENI
jgi:hypothetical protein